MPVYRLRIALPLALILLGGCVDAGVPGSPHGVVNDNVDPRVAPIVAQLEDWVRDGDLVGVEILIVEHGHTVLHRAVGWLDREGGIAMAKNTIFRLYSNSKPILGTAALMLVERGKLSLSDPVSKYLESFDTYANRDITIEHLLTHTSGLGYVAPYYDYESLSDLAEGIAAVGPEYPTGSRFEYSNQGSAVLGAVVAAVTGMPLEQFIQDSILAPLGMRDTFCNLSDDDPRRARTSCTHLWNGNECQEVWHNTSPQVARFFRGYAGIYATAADYLRFMDMWMEGGEYDGVQFLTPQTTQEALTATPLSVAAGIPYGYHWQILGEGEPLPVFGHGGFAGTFAWADPARGLLVAFFTQCVGNTAADDATIMRLVESALYGASVGPQ